MKESSKSKIGFITILAILFYLSLFAQEGFNPGKLNPEAPKETKQFGQLVGRWDAEQNIRNKDGTWSEKATKAEWRWYYILDGHAIQDDWFSSDSTNHLQWVGTNIRIYNPEEKQWHMAWIDKTNRRLAIFTAIYENGKIIMEGTNAKGRQIKNIFSDITERSFNWTQQWTFDEGKSWVEVAKIHCTKK
jgi:hypothetical protein